MNHEPTMPANPPAQSALQLGTKGAALSARISRRLPQHCTEVVDGTAPAIVRRSGRGRGRFQPPVPAVRIRLRDLLPLVAMAQKNHFIWLKDFLDDEVGISDDLHDVLMAFRGTRPA